VAYALVIIGLALMTKAQDRMVLGVLGATLSMGATAWFFRYRFTLSGAVIEYCKAALKADLADIADHYRLRPIRPDDEELMPSGASGFWVVEMEYPDGGQEIVGCVALGMNLKRPLSSRADSSSVDCSTNLDGTLESELRRMAVSPNHRRMGIAALLVETLIAHARKHHVPSIVLGTTQFQHTAMRLYRKFGWVEQRKMRTQGVWILFYKLDLAGAETESL
jgi:N-acetyltransferase 8